MAKNCLLLAILCTSPFLFTLGVNGDQINHAGDNTNNLASKKMKRSADLDSTNFANQNDLNPHSSADISESNEQNEPFKDDTPGSPHPLSMAKRAPSGFTGMRGKKQQKYNDLSPSELDWNFDDDYAYNDIRNKKTPFGFNGVRGKKTVPYVYETSLLGQLLRRLYADNEQENFYRSSAPLYPISYDDWENSLLAKRAPVGFTGMRGKRPLDLPFDGGKRNPNSFFGVRGKRDFKRSTLEQFQPNVFGFRNKFVGVRGKKDTTAAEIHRLQSQLLGSPKSNYKSSERYLIEPGFLTMKGAPNGFVGTRGKISVDTDAPDNGL